MIDVFLLIGQSNAKGCGEASKSVSPNKNCYEYIKNFTGDDLIPMAITLQLSDGCGTIAPAFSNQWNKLTNNSVCFVHYAVDGSRIKNWHHDKNLFLLEAIEKFNKSIEKISKKFDINKKYAIWIQGESDAKYGTDPLYYKDKILELADILNEKCEIEQTFVSQTGYWYGDEQNLKRCEIIASIQEIACSEQENLCLVSKKALFFGEAKMLEDDVHYTQEALNILGEDMAQNAYSFYKFNKKPKIEDTVNLEYAKKYLKQLINLKK